MQHQVTARTRAARSGAARQLVNHYRSPLVVHGFCMQNQVTRCLCMGGYRALAPWGPPTDLLEERLDLGAHEGAQRPMRQARVCGLGPGRGIIIIIISAHHMNVIELVQAGASSS
jgi:hypothetical protein